MNSTAQAETELNPVRILQKHGFNVVADGGAVIVIGKRGTIPLDRPVGAMGLLSPMTARRFDSSHEAVRALVTNQARQ